MCERRREGKAVDVGERRRWRVARVRRALLIHTLSRWLAVGVADRAD